MRFIFSIGRISNGLGLKPLPMRPPKYGVLAEANEVCGCHSRDSSVWGEIIAGQARYVTYSECLVQGATFFFREECLKIGRPNNATAYLLKIQAPSSCMIPREIEGPVSFRPESQRPITRKVRKALLIPLPEGRQNDEGVRCILIVDLQQLPKLAVVIEPSIEGDHVATRIDKRL